MAFFFLNTLGTSNFGTYPTRARASGSLPSKLRTETQIGYMERLLIPLSAPSKLIPNRAGLPPAGVRDNAHFSFLPNATPAPNNLCFVVSWYIALGWKLISCPASIMSLAAATQAHSGFMNRNVTSSIPGNSNSRRSIDTECVTSDGKSPAQANVLARISRTLEANRVFIALSLMKVDLHAFRVVSITTFCCRYTAEKKTQNWWQYSSRIMSQYSSYACCIS